MISINTPLAFNHYFDNTGNMETDSALAAFGALAKDSRLAIFRYLVEIGPEGSFVGDIALALDIRAATLSFHLKELSRASLIQSKQQGRFIRYVANFATMDALIAYLTENCCGGNSRKCVPACAPVKKTSSQKRFRK